MLYAVCVTEILTMTPLQSNASALKQPFRPSDHGTLNNGMDVEQVPVLSFGFAMVPSP